jgi:limonene-1,2-epoxide hydrolase
VCVLETIRRNLDQIDGELFVRDEGVRDIARAFAESQSKGDDEGARTVDEILRLAAFIRDRAPRLSAFLFGLVGAAADPEALLAERSRRRCAAVGSRIAPVMPVVASRDKRPLALRIAGRRAEHEHTEHFRITKDFLNARELFSASAFKTPRTVETETESCPKPEY